MITQKIFRTNFVNPVREQRLLIPTHQDTNDGFKSPSASVEEKHQLKSGFFSSRVNNIYTLLIRSILSLVFLSCPSSIRADYLWPFKEKTYITGTFGEFRKNHIHAGIDISTSGRTGIPVFAGGSGNLFRIKTQYIGFGKTVYLKLDDGKFLVYAHLDRFSPQIEKITSEAQIAQQCYEVDIYPSHNIEIKKGELIGYSGDTGGVMPHLHMELRNKEEWPINILENGLISHNTYAPVFAGLAVCDPETSFVISTYSAAGGSPIRISGKKSLAVSVFEENHGNKLGIYQIDLLIDNTLFFRIQMDKFSYDDFYDNFFAYNKDLYVNRNEVYYNLFRAFKNKLPFYPLQSDGILNLTPGRHSAVIKAKNHSGNTQTLEATIIIEDEETPPPNHIFKEWFSSDNKLRLIFDELYSPSHINISILPQDTDTKDLSPISKVYSIQPEAVVFNKAVISIKSDENTAKTGLYRFNGKRWKLLEDGSTRLLGNFCLFNDTTPPDIRIISPLRAKITDNVSGIDYAKLSLFVDGNKLISEYSVNKEELFSGNKLQPGKHEVVWIAYDKAGNMTRKAMIYE